MSFERINYLLDRANEEYNKDEERGYEGASALYEEALKLGGNTMKATNPELWAWVRMYLASSYSELKQGVKAEELDRETLKVLEGSKDIDSNDPVIAKVRDQLAQDIASNKKEAMKALHNRGFDLTKQHRFKEAEPIHEEAYLLAKKMSSQHDPMLLEIRHNYAYVLYRLDKFEQAKNLFDLNHRELSGVSESKRRNLQDLWTETEAFLAKSNEMTGDLVTSISMVGRSESWKPTSPTGAPPQIMVEEPEKPAKGTSSRGKSDLPSRGVSPEPKRKGVTSKKSAENISKSTSHHDEVKHHHRSQWASPKLDNAKSRPTKEGTPSKDRSGDDGERGRKSHSNSPKRTEAKGRKTGHASPSPSSHDEKSRSTADRTSGEAKKKAQSLDSTENTVKRPRRNSSKLKIREHDEASKERKRRLSDSTADRPPKASLSVVDKAKTKSTDSIKPNREKTVHKDAPPVQSYRDPGVLYQGSKTSLEQSKQAHEHKQSQQHHFSGNINISEYFECRKPRADTELEAEAEDWFDNLHEHVHPVSAALGPPPQRVKVAILDSGMDRPADPKDARADIFKLKWDRFKAFRDFTDENYTDYTDICGHGTNCASLVLQVAPEVDIYVAKVVALKPSDSKAHKNDLTGVYINPRHVADALKWAIDHPDKIDIISMSFGWEGLKPAVQYQLNRAHSANILVLAASSNGGRSTKTLFSYPAREESVMAIGAARGNYKTDAVFSPPAVWYKPNFLVLGEAVPLYDSKGNPVPSIKRLSGTSFATPIAAGIAALVLQAIWHPQRYGASPRSCPRLESILRSAAGMGELFKEMGTTDAKSNERYFVSPFEFFNVQSHLSKPGTGSEGETSLWAVAVKISSLLNHRFTVEEPEDEKHSQPKPKPTRRIRGIGRDRKGDE